MFHAGESEDGVTYLGNLDGEPVAIKVLNPYKPEASAAAARVPRILFPFKVSNPPCQ